MIMNQEKMALMLEAEKRGILSSEKRALLAEARERGLVNDDGFSFGEMASNIPGSAAQLGMDTITPILHPVDTAKSLYGLAAGLVEKAIPGGEDEHAQYVDLVAEHLGNRYGGVDEVLNTLEQDPVGLIADVAGIVSGGGFLAAKAGVKGARTVQKIGQAIDPLSMATVAPRAAAKGMAALSSPVDDILSAAKFSTTLDRRFGTGTRRRLAETLLREEIALNTDGVNKLDELLNEIDLEVDKILDTPAGNTRIYPAAPNINRHIPKLRQELGSVTNPNPSGNLSAVNNTVANWQKPLVARGDIPWNLQDFQKFKRNAYRDVKWAAPTDSSVGASNEALKAMARGAKDTVAEHVPEISDLNLRMGDLLELKDPLAQAASRVENRNIFGINTPIQAGGMAAVGGQLAGAPGAAVGTGIGAMRAISDIPKFKAWKAQKAYNLQNSPWSSSFNGIYGNRMLPQLIPLMMSNMGQANEITEEEQLPPPWAN